MEKLHYITEQLIYVANTPPQYHNKYNITFRGDVYINNLNNNPRSLCGDKIKSNVDLVLPVTIPRIEIAVEDIKLFKSKNISQEKFKMINEIEEVKKIISRPLLTESDIKLALEKLTSSEKMIMDY